MLQNIRDKSSGIVTWFIIGALILVFALWGISYYLTGPAPGQQVVVTVNGHDITSSELEWTYQQARQHDANKVLNEQEQNQLRQQLLQGLITQQILRQSAIKAGLYISRAQIDQLIYSMPVFQINHEFSIQRYNMVLQNLGLTTQQLRQMFATSILINQQRLGILASSFLLPQEMARLAALKAQTRNFEYVVVNHNQYTSSVNISSAQIQHYYQTHLSDYMLPAKVQLAYIMLSLPEVASSVSPTQQQLQSYYQQNQQNFVDPQTHEVKPFSDVESQVQEAVKTQLAQQRYSQLGNQLANITFENPNSLSQASKQLNLPIQTTDYFTKQGAQTGLAQYQSVLQVAFGNNVLKQRNNSDIINISPTEAVVVRVNQYQPAQARPLSEVSAQIQQTLILKAAQQSAKVHAQAILQALQKGSTPHQLANRENLSWVGVENVGRDDAAVPASIRRVAFNQPAPANGAAQNAIVAMPEGSYAIVHVTHMVLPIVNLNAQSPEAMHALDQQQASNDYTLLLNSLMANATIRHHS